MQLYAIPTHSCNLTCPHCHIKDSEEYYNRELFLEKLNSFYGNIVLFGGEPTSNRERMLDIIESNNKNGISKISSIATNLIILDDELLNIYKSIGRISTSWNKSRFTLSQYNKWLNNCNLLEGANVDCLLLITLTGDLLDCEVDEFLNIVDQWNSNVINNIKFEHYIGPENTPEYFDSCDKWLCELFKSWRSNIYVQNFDPNIRYYFDCDNMFTLEPSGTIHNSCPNGLYVDKSVVSQCLVCDRASSCRPCKLQRYCSYPVNLRKLIKGDE